MTVAAILSGKGEAVVTCPVEASVRDAVALLARHRIGAMPVTDAGGAVAGMFSERDLLYGLASDGAVLLDRGVAAVMTTPAVTVARDTSLLAALALMTRRRIRHLPVVEDGRLVGLVSIGDLVKMRIDRIEAEADAMRAYIAGA